MAWIAALLILAAIALIAWGIRGRVVGIGEFCAQCRFDLAGIDLDNKFAECPECGRRVSDSRARIATRRAVSRPRITIGAALFILAAPVLALRIAGGVGAIYPHLADRHVAYAARWGDEAALDEFVTRLSVGSNIDPGVWDPMIDHALDHQGDRTEPWDPRWGEVLARAAEHRLLSDAQLSLYAEQGIDIRFETRETIHANARFVPTRMRWAFKRISSQSGRSIPVMVSVGIPEFRIEGESAMGGGSIGMSVPSSGTRGGSSTLSGGAPIPRESISIGVGSIHDVEARIEISAEYEGASGESEPRFVTRTDSFRVVSRDTRLVERVHPGSDLDQVAGIIRVTDVKLAPGPDTKRAERPAGPLQVDVIIPKPSVSIAVRVTAVVGEARLNLGSIVVHADSSTGQMRGLRWPPPRHQRPDPDIASRFYAMLVERGRVDLEFRTDPALALERVGIDRVHAIDFVMLGVPVRATEDREEMFAMKIKPPIERNRYRIEPIAESGAP